MHTPPTLEQLITEEQWREAFPVLQTLWPDLSLAVYLQRRLRLQQNGYSLFGLRDAGSLVAVAGVQTFELLARGRALWLFDMATSGECQGQGHGSALLELIQQHARAEGYTRLLLHTANERERTIDFYRTRIGEPFGVVFRVLTDVAQ